MSDTDDYRAAQAKEYGQYVATQDITVGNALAYIEGQAVPVSNVQAFGYLEQGLVRAVADVAADEQQQAHAASGGGVEVVPPAPVE